MCQENHFYIISSCRGSFFSIEIKFKLNEYMIKISRKRILQEFLFTSKGIIEDQ